MSANSGRPVPSNESSAFLCLDFHCDVTVFLFLGVDHPSVQCTGLYEVCGLILLLSALFSLDALPLPLLCGVVTSCARVLGEAGRSNENKWSSL